MRPPIFAVRMVRSALTLARVIDPVVAILPALPITIHRTMRDVNLPWTTSGTVNRRLCLSACCIIVDHDREIKVTPVRKTQDIFAIGARFNLMDNVVTQITFLVLDFERPLYKH